MANNCFYVYSLIDPRNLREFYIGKGKGDRIFDHIKDPKDSKKTRIINQIEEEGLEPIIRILAKNLSNEQALLVEKTLIWKMAGSLSNIATGNFSSNFRPPNTLHKKLFGFDYENGVYYVNVGEGDGKTRVWEDCKTYGFISAGQDWMAWGRKVSRLNPGDIIAAYLAGYGYVGIGVVKALAVKASVT